MGKGKAGTAWDEAVRRVAHTRGGRVDAMGRTVRVGAESRCSRPLGAWVRPSVSDWSLAICEWSSDAGDTAVRPRQQSCGVQAAWQDRGAAAELDEQGTEPEQAEEAAVEGGGRRCEGADDNGQCVGCLCREMKGVQGWGLANGDKLCAGGR